MKDLIAKLQMDANCALGAIWMHIEAREKRIAELEAQQAFGIGETYANALSRIAELESEVTRLSASWRGDATVADALEEHIAELEAQIAAAATPVVEQKPVAWLSEQWGPSSDRTNPEGEWQTVATISNPTEWDGFRNPRPLVFASPQAADTGKLREAIANISNNQITEAWESCGGVDGFYKSFGFQQFAHAILDLAADTVASTALQAPVREVPETWISVEDRMPEPLKDVLIWEKYSTSPCVAYHNGHDWAASQEHYDTHSSYGPGAYLVDKLTQDLITHWMPLPAAPVQEPKP